MISKAPKIKKQSTNHLLMIEPASFFVNPQTMATNAYQSDDHAAKDVTSAQALKEFRAFRDKLIESGVSITTVRGHAECPDMVFPNWFFTFSDGRMILCPMLNQNRRDERSPEIIALLNKIYPQLEDWTEYEDFDLPLESTASIVSDRVNKKCYAALSPRTDEGLVRKWVENEGYEVEMFNTQSHKKDVPVYHTDCVIWIGSTLAGVCSECIVEEDRQRIVSSLRETHEVIEFNNEQLRDFCGNALEVVGAGGDKMLALSERAMGALSEQQMETCREHFSKLIYSPLDTLERYGGGSARCMLAELL
ncbi:MAG: arginine deiminase-related protein [Pseudomonadota bacterium]